MEKRIGRNPTRVSRCRWATDLVSSVAEYAPVFLKWLSFVRKRSDNTVRSYGEDLKSFLGFCETAGLSKPDDVSFRHLEFYVGWLQQQRGLKPASANRHIQALRTF
jgi:site-specific recombinase XerD